MSKKDPYNPLAKENLGESVADALLRVKVKPLDETSHLIGAGVYAIYYTGDFRAYRAVKERNERGRYGQPIYVGKAVPKGARKGGLSFDASGGRALRDRLRQHAGTIDQAINLGIKHFQFRALMVDDIWIPLGENVLIEKFQPLWNMVIDGFGNKTPGAGRGGSKQSQWDTLHPGRKFVTTLSLAPNALSKAQVVARIDDFFAGRLAKSEQLSKEEEA